MSEGQANLGAFLALEMNRLTQAADEARRSRAARDKGLLEERPREAARLRAASASSLEHSRVSALEIAPRPLASDRVLRGTTITGGEDEEKRRRLPEVGAGAAKRPRPSGDTVSSSDVIGRGAPLMSRARALAQGYQPAVVKVVSYAHGAARASATANYVDREDALLETPDGAELKGRVEINAEIADWAKDFEPRKESQDVGPVRFQVMGLKDTPADRQTLKDAMSAAFAGHRYAFRIDALKDGAIEARAVVAFAGTIVEGEEVTRERFYVTARQVGAVEGFAERIFAPKSEARMKARIEEATGIGQHRIVLEPGAPGNGSSSVVDRLTRLQERGAAISDSDALLDNPSAIQAESRAWRRDLRSFKPRDTMHLIISTKAGVDVDAFKSAVRGFVHEQFAEHKFMFGVHTDKTEAGHVHAHVIVAVRNVEGVKIHPGPPDFRHWRETFAEHAQMQGLKIVATSAAERASSQSYGPRDKAIVEAADHPRPGREARDRAYAGDPANKTLIDKARRRIEIARTNPIRVPTSERQLAVANDSASTWRQLAREEPQSATASALAQRMLFSQAAGQAIATLVNQALITQTTRTSAMSITAAQMGSDLKLLNEAVDKLGAVLPADTRAAFFERSGRYLEKPAARVDMQREFEAKSSQAVLAPVVEEAARIARVDQREAISAQRVMERVVGRRVEAAANPVPASARDIDRSRVIVREAERTTVDEQARVHAALEAQRLLAANSTAPLAASLAVDARLEALRREQMEKLRQISAEKEAAGKATALESEQ
ncbi:relaxase/mobilization nuclease domain-containing protein [Methylocystis iwaonis]|uniref:relaxase/mobilization nuclease domain-containing protein n=1 Tax=Methylocystis iwaonis TaxID=2885079 RepID=UPI002E7C4D11|nr:relaxase/mobilization nuclease domain-containing protein [Methylocystis iwaonis]